MSATSRKKRKDAQRRQDAEAEQAAAPWRRLLVDVPEDAVDGLCAFMTGLDPLGLEVVDDDTRAFDRSPEQRAAERTGRATVIATFPNEDGIEARVVAQLGHVLRALGPPGQIELSWEDLFAEDWTAVFKSHWKPLKLTARVWIVPSWEEQEIPAGDVALHLDPGMAFGTGTHPTTRLCANALDDVCRAGAPATLLDVGTGSGILALTARKLGVAAAIGTDIDPVALKAADENAARNGVDRFVTTQKTPAALEQQFPAVIANILCAPLLALAPEIAGAVAPGGRLWLSGLLENQGPEIIERYTAFGLRHDATTVDTGWIRVDFTRP